MIHLMKIEEIQHVKDNNVIWEQKNIDNVFHSLGHYFLLNVAFRTSTGIEVPSSYYLGLDNRTSTQSSDTFSSLSGEPTQNGYTRQAVNSLNGFTVSLDTVYKAVSGTVTFTATGGSWGPVKNLFMATSSGSTGYLLATSTLDTSRTVLEGESLIMRISVALTGA